MELLIVSGLSGAGKSAAGSILEDIGYYCVDNLPANLIPQLVAQCMSPSFRFDRVSVVIDIRGSKTFEDLFTALDELDRMNCPYQILFLDADTKTIIRRFKETRRSHPLNSGGVTLEEAIALEREAMQPVRDRAEYIIDTSSFSTANLRSELIKLFGGEDPTKYFHITVSSFGYKYGLPLEADLVFDVRFLPNPYYIDSLRDLTGLDREVSEFVFGFEQTTVFMEKTTDLLTFLLPRYIDEGKTGLVIALGCTGGRHRSVAISHMLATVLADLGYTVTEIHRDISR